MGKEQGDISWPQIGCRGRGPSLLSGLGMGYDAHAFHL